MKVVISAIIILLILIGTVTGGLFALNSVSKNLEERAMSAKTQVYSNDFANAKIIIDDLNMYWEKNEHLLCSMINHEEIDTIKISMAKSVGYISVNEKSDLLSELSVLEVMFRHLREAESLTLGNLF